MVSFTFKMYCFHSRVFNDKIECISFQFPMPNSKHLLLYAVHLLVFLRLLRVLQDCKSNCFVPSSFVAKKSEQLFLYSKKCKSHAT